LTSASIVTDEARLALGLLDARKFAINLRPRRFIAQEQFLSAARAHGLENVVGVHGIQRTRGRVGGFGAGGFRDEPRGEERLQNLLREPGGNAQFGGNFLDRDRRQASVGSAARCTSSAGAR
jgi:hypothetical protein